MNITPPQVKESNTVAVQEQIYNAVMSEKDIIAVKDIQPGDHFQGVMWALEIKSYPNRYEKDKVDERYTLVGKDGRVITAMMYAQDIKIDMKDTPISLEGYCLTHDNIINQYRLTKATISKIPISRSFFLKEIPNIDLQVQKFLNHYNSIQNIGLKGIITSICDNGYINTLKQDIYKPKLGTSLGIKLWITNALIDMIQPFAEIKNVNWDIYKAAAILYHYSTQEQIYFTIDEDLYRLIMHTETLTPAEKGLLIHLLNPEALNKSAPERVIFQGNLNTIEKIIYAQESLS